MFTTSHKNKNDNFQQIKPINMKSAIILSLLPFTFDSAVAGSLRRKLPENVAQGTCAEDADSFCHRFATCVDLDDNTFHCVCNEGYEGDGFWTCNDVDECQPTNGGSPCPSAQSGGFCVNTFVHDPDPATAKLEGYMCGCNPFMGVVDGPRTNVHGPTTCIDVNECLDPDLNNCDVNAQCTNSFGSFSCECNEGFTGDGTFCTEVPSASPSEMPSSSPSDAPSSVPSLLPSEVPSEYPSDVPSRAPRVRSRDTSTSAPIFIAA